MGKFEKLRDALEIDKYDLDEEWVRNPDLVYRLHEQCAFVRAERDRLKQIVEQTFARLYEELKNGEDKISETHLKQKITLHKDMQAAEDNLITKNAVLSEWEGLREKAKERGASLKYLSELHLSGYYVQQSGGKVRREAEDAEAARVRRAVSEESPRLPRGRTRR